MTLVKKSPSERFLVSELGIFQSFESFCSWSSRRSFGRKTFKVGIVVDYVVKPFFSRFCWWFLFPEKDKQVCFFVSRHKTAPHWWFSNGVLPNRKQNTWPTKRNIAGTWTSNEDFPENCAKGIFQESPCYVSRPEGKYHSVSLVEFFVDFLLFISLPWVSNSSLWAVIKTPFGRYILWITPPSYISIRGL